MTSPDPDAVRAARLRNLLAGYSAIESFHDFKTRAGKIPHVDFHVVLWPEMTAREAHGLYLSLPKQVRAIAGPATKVLMHADPASR